MKIKTENSAKLEKDGSITLTDDLHQSGRAIITSKVNITKKPWKLTSVVSMSNNQGISDSDGTGGDGIWFEFNEKQFSIGLDSFHNEYNNSGNEINLFVEGQVVAKEYCPVKLNSGEKITVDIVCKPSPKTFLVVAINKKTVLVYAMKTMNLEYLFPEDATLSMYAFTGDAASKQVVHSIKLKTLSKKNESPVDN